MTGRRPPARARADLVYGIAASRLTLEIDLGLAVREAALALLPLDTRAFAAAQARLETLIDAIKNDIGLTFDWRSDGFGCRWIVLSSSGLEELAISIGIVADELDRAGHSNLLLCAAFVFEVRSTNDGRLKPYLVYNFERGSFYPFVTGGSDRRDARKERELASLLGGELRLEADQGLWYPLWDIPLARSEDMEGVRPGHDDARLRREGEVSGTPGSDSARSRTEEQVSHAERDASAPFRGPDSA